MKTIFEKILHETQSVEELIIELMITTGPIIRVDDFFVFLVDPESRTDLAQGYYFSQQYFDQQNNPTVIHLDTKLNIGLLKRVTIRGAPLSYLDSSSVLNMQTNSNRHFCIPIKDMINDIYGLIYVINQIESKGEKETLRLLKMFADLVGSGTYHLSFLRKVFPSYEVTSEILDYHLAPKKHFLAQTLQTLKKFGKKKFKKSYIQLNFDPWLLSFEKSFRIVYSSFKHFNIFQEFKIDSKIFTHWVLTVRNSYREIPFHNWEHAVGVFQTSIYILSSTSISPSISMLEKFGIMIACLCHHLDHRATSNTFLLLSNSALTRLYSKSFLEEHHVFWCFKILSMPGNHILRSLPQKTYKEFVTFVEECILATNASSIYALMRMRKLPTLLTEIKTHDPSWETVNDRTYFHKIMLPACDMNGYAKKLKIHIRYTVKMYEEYFLQANLEKDKGMISNSDLAMYSRLPQNQVDFMENFCFFIFETISTFLPELANMESNCRKNYNYWEQMSVKMTHKFFHKYFFIGDKEKQNIHKKFVLSFINSYKN